MLGVAMARRGGKKMFRPMVVGIVLGSGLSLAGFSLTGVQAAEPPVAAEEIKRVDDASSPNLPKAFQTGARWLRSAIDSMRVEQPESPLPTPTGPSRLPQATIEIEAARRHQQNLFRGSVLESASGHVDDRAEFARALKKVADEHASSQRAEAEKAAAPLPAAPAELPRAELPRADESLRGSLSAENSDMAGIAAEMRGVAWSLDEMAAEREEEGNYAAADRLRLAAQRVRREARELLHPAPASDRALHR